MADKRNFVIIFVIALLFAVFVFAAIDAVYPRPQYNDFCEEKFVEPRLPDEQQIVEDQECRESYDAAREKYEQFVFYISAVLSLVAIFLGLYLPAHANTLNESIGSGFMLGGVFALFFGTIRSFSELGRFTRPIVILLELVLIIYIAYKKLGNSKK
ncbi:MAG: hypothetical protein ABH849_01430 [Nanoarchaeota archaeon]